MSNGGRNEAVEAAVTEVLAAVDASLAGTTADLPSAALRRSIDAQIERRASVRVASIFLIAYSISDERWDFDHIPTGVRGQYGDKRLSSELSNRSLTLHDNITAFGENLGWKGNVQEFRLTTDDRFSEFVETLSAATEDDRRRALAYFAGRFAASQRVQDPLPPLPTDLLTFARARALFHEIISTPSEGHIQQFVVAGLIRIHRRRFGHAVRTHHPHASDKFDRTAGDVEEFREGVLVAAYEVTVRADWKNRLPDFRQKMLDHSLSKYWIIASEVYNDTDLASPSSMLSFLDPSEVDLAVVDLDAFIDVFLAELTASELREVVNDVYKDLLNPSLSNRQEFIEAYLEVVGEWLDAVS